MVSYAECGIALGRIGIGRCYSGSQRNRSRPIPVIIDQNTAQWSLHQGASIGAITKLNYEGRVVYFKTVGLLSNSVLQGKAVDR